MTLPLIWLHDEALRASHPVFSAAPKDCRAIYIWDNDYLQAANYSLKRLVFIYECLSELPVDIIRGNTKEVIQHISPSLLYIPTSQHPLLLNLIHALSGICTMKEVNDESFVTLAPNTPLTRFSKYWNVAQLSALTQNGGNDA